MKKAIGLLIAVVLFSIPAFTIDDARLLRFPDVNKDRVVFVYAGDIWTVPATGGDAQRLTSHKGSELFPRLSPDGLWIAFSGEYSGSRQIFVMPASGGTPRQLTYYNEINNMPPRGGVDHIPLDWTPDSKQILIRANRTPYEERLGKYFLVSLDGGLEKPLPIPEGGFGTFSPDAKNIVYTPISREFRTWKRTKAGRAQDVWTYDLEQNKSQRITTFSGTDQHPIWYKDKIYYVSDQSLTLNFWSYDLKTREFKQVTDYKEYDVLWPAGENGRVAYENGGYIYILDLDSGVSTKLTVNLHFDNPNRLPYFKNVAAFVSRFGAHLSPNGSRVILDARGDLFSVPAEKGVTQNLTRTQETREMVPVCSPDGKWIAYIADNTGDYELYLLDPEQKRDTIQLTHDTKVWKFPPVWSPDGKMLAFADKNRNLFVLDIQSQQIFPVDKGNKDDLNKFSWSGDSQWLVYTKDGENRLSRIMVYSLAKKTSSQLSSGRYKDMNPVFSDCGKYIFFISDRDFSMSRGDDFSSMEFDFVYHKTSRIYAMALTRDVPDLFKEENDLDKTIPRKEASPDTKNGVKAGASKDETAKKTAPAPVLIDFEGIAERITVFPIPTDQYMTLVALDGKILYNKGRDLYQFDLKTKKSELVVADARLTVVSADKKKMLVNAGGKNAVLEIKPEQKLKDMKETKETKDVFLNTDDVTMKIDPVKEWQQIYNEGWRIYRDWFYVRNMHGVDWPKIKEKYARLLPYVGHRADLDYIFGEMVGELNIGHTYVNWGDFETVTRVDTGLLGADLIADEKAGRYQIAKIYKGENWNENTRSPLTELGLNIKEGDYIIGLNGFNVTTRDNPYQFLENTAGKRITITVNSLPKAEGARTLWIKTIRSEKDLFHFDWVESRRRLVDTLSQGRIGYIYVPDTGVEGNGELFKGVYAFNDKDAFIVDDRYNGGGWSPVKMIEKLTQPITSYWSERDLDLRHDPMFALRGPMVMLINYYSSSGGDNFPFWFRSEKRGILIGTRTWGGLVGYSWSPGLVDGPSFAVPSTGIVSTSGEYIVEGEGVCPDEGYEVYDLPEEIAKGNDPSIEKAVAYLLNELAKNPPKKVNKPAEPDRSKWHEKRQD